MWIARDKDNCLFLWNMKPDTCINGYWLIKDKPTLHYLKIDSSLFPNLKYNDGPIEVEIVSKNFMDDWRTKNAFEARLFDLEEGGEMQFEIPGSIQEVINDHFDEML